MTDDLTNVQKEKHKTTQTDVCKVDRQSVQKRRGAVNHSQPREQEILK